MSLGHLYAALREETPDEVTRGRLRRAVLEALQRPVHRPAEWVWRPGVYLAAAAVALSVGLATILGYLGRPTDNREPTLKIHADGGVHLEWTDVGRSRYQILMSTDPADFSRARTAMVKGTAYVDRDPHLAAVIYYRVE